MANTAHARYMDYFQSGPYTWVLGFLALAPRLGPAVRCSFPANAVAADRWPPAISSVEALTGRRYGSECHRPRTRIARQGIISNGDKVFDGLIFFFPFPRSHFVARMVRRFAAWMV